MSTRAWQFHGMNLTVTGAPRLLDALHGRLQHFQAGDTTRDSDLHFCFVNGLTDRWSMPAHGRVVAQYGDYKAVYVDDLEQIYFEIKSYGRLIGDVPTRQVNVMYGESAERNPVVLAGAMFTLPLLEISKRQGLYSVHAAGLSLGEKGILIAGESGAGKTTLAIALVRDGFDFLGDDTVFLSRHSNYLKILAFPDQVDITRTTAEFFPEMRASARAGTDQRQKTPVSLFSLYGIKPRWQCVPRAIVFPRHSVRDESVLEPMRKDEALLELVCNVLRTESESAQKHLDVLAELVERCRCYRLWTGRDFGRLAALFRKSVD